MRVVPLMLYPASCRECKSVAEGDYYAKGNMELKLPPSESNNVFQRTKYAALSSSISVQGIIAKKVFVIVIQYLMAHIR